MPHAGGVQHVFGRLRVPFGDGDVYGLRGLPHRVGRADFGPHGPGLPYKGELLYGGWGEPVGVFPESGGVDVGVLALLGASQVLAVQIWLERSRASF